MISLKYILIMVLPVVLNGCSGCWSPMPVTSCGPIQSDISAFSKDNISLNEKLNDLKDCGAIPDKNGNFIKEMVELKTSKIADNKLRNYIDFEARKQLGICMKNKGYQ